MDTSMDPHEFRWKECLPRGSGCSLSVNRHRSHPYQWSPTPCRFFRPAATYHISIVYKTQLSMKRRVLRLISDCVSSFNNREMIPYPFPFCQSFGLNTRVLVIQYCFALGSRTPTSISTAVEEGRYFV